MSKELSDSEKKISQTAKIHAYYCARKRLPDVLKNIGESLDPERTLVVAMFENSEAELESGKCQVVKMPIADNAIMMPSREEVMKKITSSEIVGSSRKIQKAFQQLDGIDDSEGAQNIASGLKKMDNELGGFEEKYDRVIFVCQSGLSRSPRATEVFAEIMYQRQVQCYIDNEKSCPVVYDDPELQKRIVGDKYRIPRNFPIPSEPLSSVGQASAQSKQTFPHLRSRL